MAKKKQEFEGPRGTRPEEYRSLVDLLSTVFNPGLDLWLPGMFNQGNLENLRIIVADGKVVSHVGIASGYASLDGCKVGIGRIGCVATYVEYRGRGYASLLMQDAMTKMEAEGIDVMLVSGGRGLYRRINCADAGIQAMAELQGGALTPAPPEIELRAVEPGDTDFMVKAYSTKKAHFIRSREHMETLLSGNAGMRRQKTQLVILKDGEPAAYAILGWRRKNDGGFVREQAGKPKALVDGLRAVMCEYAVSHLHMSTGAWDRGLLNELKRRKVEVRLDYGGYTVKILNPQRFLDRVRPLIARKTGEGVAKRLKVEGTPDDMTVRLGRQAVRVEGQMPPQLFFGTPDNHEKAWYPKSGALREVLEKALPIPLPLYELDYV
jgi:GNAT superfamily N-acetyltransferase